MVEELGLDAAIDYKHPTASLKEQFEEHCPDGIDFFYDNVGGEILNEVLLHLNKHGRVVICGAISQYGKKQKQGPSNYIRISEQSGTMAGFVVLHYPFGMLLAFLNLVWLYFRGHVRSFEQVYEGIDEFPHVLQKLYEGGNIGKPIINLPAD
jgi:NADPH-dependent curcumin reductase CurA